MTTPRGWVQIGMLAHVVSADETLCGLNLALDGADSVPPIPPRIALCAACYEADRRET